MQPPPPPEEDNAAVAAAADVVLGNNFDAVTKTCFITILKLLDNVIQTPTNPLYQSVNLQNRSVQEKILRAQGGRELLLAVGFVVPPPEGESSLNDRLVLPLSTNLTPTTTTILNRCIAGRHLLENRLLQDLRCPPDDLPKYKPPPPQKVAPSGAASTSNSTISSFNPYQGQRFDALSAAVGVRLGPDDSYKSPTEAEVERLERQRRALQEKSKRSPLSRQWHATRPGASNETTTSTMDGDVPPAGSSDMGLLAARAMQQNANAAKAEKQGFTTAAMRKLQKLQSAVVYDYAILRFTLPDGVTVRGHFAPHERLEQVRTIFATECLSDPNVMFDICDVAPPRAVLAYDRTLEELRLVPAAKVTIRWQEAKYTSTVRPELFLQQGQPPSALSSTTTASNETASSSFPTANSVAEAAAATTTRPAADSNTKSNVPTAADREEELMRRMMGGGGGKKKPKGGAGDNQKPASSAAPKWFAAPKK
jgi:hypothetical protein